MLEIFDNGGWAHFKNIIISFLNKVAKSIDITNAIFEQNSK